MEQYVRSPLWSLPLALQKAVLGLAFRDRYAKLMRLREADLSGYSCKPFHETRSLFVHIPKTGGISLAKSLYGGPGAGHLTLRFFRLVLTPRELDSYFKFAFVRNPWDRLASAFFFLKDGGMRDLDARWAREHLGPYDDFESFVLRWVNRERVYSWRHFIPQFEFLRLRGPRPRVDFVGRFEQLAEGYRTVCERLGTGGELLHLNRTKSKRQDYRTLYRSDEMMEIVAEAYREDVELFGYRFEDSGPTAQPEA